MKKLTHALIVLLSILIVNCQQSTTNEEVTESVSQEEMVANAVDILYKGIVEADQIQLEAITVEELIYGHSNGRVQNKSEFIAEIMDPEALDFVSADLTNQNIKIVGETAIVRHIFTAETNNKGTPGSLSIGVMLVWKKVNGDWKLLARQAYRLQ